MKIVLAGGSGFLGRALTRALAAEGHEVVVLTRRSAERGAPAGARFVVWNPHDRSGSWAAEIDKAGAIVNLAGESIAAGRWSERRKRRILESRVRVTRSLVDALARATTPPPVFASASAVGYYGPRASEIVTEETPAGSDFLAEVCVAWETEAGRAASPRTRVVCYRTGLVLDREGGALPRMLLPFRLGAGGALGSGRQYWPWIHLEDWVRLVCWSLVTPEASGPLNLTAPEPVTNAEFASSLGRAMRRPALLPAPSFALRAILGEMADALLLSGQRAVPARAQRLGFTFRHSNVDRALAAIFARSL
jgi:hypothetical protein